MRKFRKWHDYLIERLAADKEEAIGYLDVALEEYQEDGDTPFFLKGIKNVVEAQGVFPSLPSEPTCLQMPCRRFFQAIKHRILTHSELSSMHSDVVFQLNR